MMCREYMYGVGDLLVCTNNPFEEEFLKVGKLYKVAGMEVMNGDEVYAVLDEDEKLGHAIASKFTLVDVKKYFAQKELDLEQKNKKAIIQYIAQNIFPKMTVEELLNFIGGN